MYNKKEEKNKNKTREAVEGMCPMEFLSHSPMGITYFVLRVKIQPKKDKSHEIITSVMQHTTK